MRLRLPGVAPSGLLGRQRRVLGRKPELTIVLGAPDGSCVEQRAHDGRIEVRDTEDRSGPVLRFTHAEFAAWLDGSRSGEFDHLLDGV
jgi:hypothetical protein